MNKKFIFSLIISLLIILLFSNFTYAKGRRNLGEIINSEDTENLIFGFLIKETNLTANVLNQVEKTNPEVVESVNSLCVKTAGARDIFTFITIASIFGLAVPPVGIAGLIFSAAGWLGLFCV
ncbi:hypothetical protein KY366_04275 [Candidatus Woesearchaeota archaeon]|nr:hypothetical protein [Candidatus Woesearchaeota archaeon]